MCKGTEGHPGEIGEPGPPTLEALIREWVKEDPILSKHFFFTTWTEGTYIETRCPFTYTQPGWSLAMLPNEEETDKRVMILYHGLRSKVGETLLGDYSAKLRGYLKKEDPKFIEKLRYFLVRGHDALQKETGCKIKWKFGDVLPDIEEHERQQWFAGGEDL